MDTTPEKSKNNQNATSLKRFLDSPIFDFLNTLSPMKPVKPTPYTQTINPLTFSSLQSVFTSPHATSDPSRLEFPTNDWNTVNQNKSIVDADHKENMEDPTPHKNPQVSIEPSNIKEWSAIIAELMRSPEQHISEHASNSYHTNEQNLEGVGSWDNAVISKPSHLSLEIAMQKNTLPFGGVLSDSCSNSGYMENEEINPCGSRKKRRTSEQSGEGGGSCKRCNCKKSKCLKLYCRCFAAGVYCIGGTCACTNCFNKPINKDIVLATRRQMESRNPLAFAPKVIVGSDSLSEMGDDFETTPESVRHKRGGCNCKKSGCLKKYCECYTCGVGCSIYCRCEGCKNEFGTKKEDGSGVLVMEHEVEECETNVSKRSEELNEIFQKNFNTPLHLPE